MTAATEPAAARLWHSFYRDSSRPVTGTQIRTFQIRSTPKPGKALLQLQVACNCCEMASIKPSSSFDLWSQ